MHILLQPLNVWQVEGCALSPDGTLLATSGQDGVLCVTDIASQSVVYSAEFNVVRFALCARSFVLKELH